MGSSLNVVRWFVALVGLLVAVLVAPLAGAAEISFCSFDNANQLQDAVPSDCVDVVRDPLRARATRSARVVTSVNGAASPPARMTLSCASRARSR